MLDIYRNEAKKTTTAVIKGSKQDAVNHIAKRLKITTKFEAKIYNLGAAIMQDKYSGTVTCDERDTYDAAVGEDEAVKKAMDNHKNGFTKAILRWQVSMIKKIKNISPETFDEALNKVK
jgi:phosphotransferase system IIB component